MTKTKLTVCVVAWMIGLAGGAFADGAGRVTQIVTDRRPCIFFQTNSNPTYYAFPSSDVNKSEEDLTIWTSKVVPGQNVWFWVSEWIACDANWTMFQHADGLTLY